VTKNKEEFREMRIATNTVAMYPQRMLHGVIKSTNQNLEKIASGFRLNRAADDPASLPISEKMRNQVSGLKQAIHNAQDGISMVQTAEGALIEINTLLTRMRNLAVQAGTDTLRDGDRAKTNHEFTILRKEINRIANTTEFNTKKLLDGSLDTGITFQVGANTGPGHEITIVLPAVTTKALNIDGDALAQRQEAIDTLEALDAASDRISTTRSSLGVTQQQLEHTINNLGLIATNVASSESRIRDVDMGNEITSFSKNQILTQAATAVLAQANAKPKSVLKIVR
jgi:flagellin